jgi:hypothetical protein
VGDVFLIMMVIPPEALVSIALENIWYEEYFLKLIIFVLFIYVSWQQNAMGL